MKLIESQKLPNGKFKVNKSAVIAKLMKANKAKREALALGVLPVTQQEIDQELTDLTRYKADSFIQGDE